MINDAVKRSSVNQSIQIPESLQKKLIESGKEEDFNTFKANLPGGNSIKVITGLLNKLTSEEQDEFVKILYSKDSIADISSNDYSSGVGSKLYDLEPKGIGKAELLLATLIRNSKVLGGGESFDLTVGNKKYEVKDYRNYPNTRAIRLGTKGKVTRFLFWQEINKTLSVINDLVVSDGIKFIQNEDLIQKNKKIFSLLFVEEIKKLLEHEHLDLKLVNGILEKTRIKSLGKVIQYFSN
jgi:hypothetical protein